MDRKKIFGVFGGFLAVMLVFTILSRAVSGASMAYVETVKISTGTIEHKVVGSGKVEAGKEIAVYTESGQRVKEICVREGQIVQEGDLLFQVDLDELEEQIIAARQEIEKLQLQNQDVQSSQNLDQQNREIAQNRAAEDYNQAVTQGDAALAKAKEAWDAAEAALQEFLQNSNQANKGSGQNTNYNDRDNNPSGLKGTESNNVLKVKSNKGVNPSKIKRMENNNVLKVKGNEDVNLSKIKRMESNNVLKVKGNEDVNPSKIKRMESIDKEKQANNTENNDTKEDSDTKNNKEENDIEETNNDIDTENIDTKQENNVQNNREENHTEEINNIRSPIDTEENDTKENSDTQNNKEKNDTDEDNNTENHTENNIEDNSDGQNQNISEGWEEQKAALERAVAEAKANYEAALASRTDNIKAAARAMEDAARQPAADSTSKQNEITKQQQELALNKLLTLQQAEGKVTSPVRGMITQISITTGDFTSEGTAIRLADISQGNRLVASVDKSNEEYISKGSPVNITVSGSKDKITNYTISNIKENEEDKTLLDITIDLPEGVLDSGISASIEIVQKSKNYSTVLPVQAIHEEQNSYYVLILQEEKGVMGTELVVKRFNVEIQDKNNTDAALADGILTGDQEIVSSSSRSISEGSRVRRKEQ